MKKVAYNACFGGFGLSPLAETQYMAKKGVQLFWYKELGHENLVRIDDVNSIGAGWMGPNASKKDLGPTVKKYPMSISIISRTHHTMMTAHGKTLT